MGCTTSKLDNEDTVQRCKERRRLIKEAVYARHHLAAAHSDYCHSLRITGSALVTFAYGEPFSVSDHSPAVHLRTSSAKPSPQPSIHSPPLSKTSSHHQKPPPPPRRRRSQAIKLPHILSDSSFSSSSPPPNPNYNYTQRANSTYSSTASQASSVWNWDDFYPPPPPPPPDSEYFNHLQSHKNEYNDNSDDKASDFTSYTIHGHQYQNLFDGNEAKQFDDRASNYSSYSLYPETKNYTRTSPKPVQNLNRWENKDEETQREEVQCSEWRDHDNFSTTSTSNEEENLNFTKSDFETTSNFESVKNEAANIRNAKNSKFSSISEKLSDDENVNSERRIVVRHRDLAEIVAALNEYFDKAASVGDQVSEMLEAGRDQLNRSFKKLRKTVYHSSGMLINLSSSWTSKPPLTVKYQFEPSSIDQPGGPKSLCSTLERLLAWEKKLYQDVKAREGVKIELAKKLSALQNQEYRGEEDAKLDKTKASIKRLQSLIVVTSQSVSTTSFAIIGLRDSDLIPQLIEICHGVMYMWRSMNQFHKLQDDIVVQVRGLVNHMTKDESTSDLHQQATRDLVSAVSAWHSSFCHLIKFQRYFVRSLHRWFELTLIPVDNEPTDANRELSEVFAFFDEWKLALERIPDTVASEAIKSLNNVVHSIYLKQTEEMKIRKRTEAASKDLEKKSSSIRNIEKKYYQSYSMVGIGPPGPENGHVLDARDPLAEKKAELVTCQRRVEDEIVKHSKAVEVTKAMTLNNIQTGLPGVFQAMTTFSAIITEALETVCTRSYAI